jgi:dTDP-glucose 4,6-dehydratase
VKGNDVARIEDAWKLEGVKDQISYLWKSTMDLNVEDLKDIDLIFDCGLEFADRPLGISSPTHTLIGNLLPPLRLLEVLRKIRNSPTVVYASSFNALYGYEAGTCYTEALQPNPSSQYGWTKASAELLYSTYSKAFNLPVIITRVGSAYGARMRSDELIAKLILYCLQGKTFYLKSPQASRLWTYSEDVMSFYTKMLENPRCYIGKVLHCAGNVGDKVITNAELAQLVSKIMGKKLKVFEDAYEAGELINGKPIGFTVDCSITRELMGWKPKFTLEEGLKKTVEWFNENSCRKS